MLKRHILSELEAYLNLMPVTLLTGARQTGKTTLVEQLAQQRNFSYATFDDDLTLSNAERDPSGWLASMPTPLIIDEVQRIPELFLSLKYEVDKHRTPGRYLLTGSANPLLLPKLGDSLAGRMGVVTLFPFSQGELNGHKETFVPWLFGDLAPRPFGPFSLLPLLLRGGFPPVQTLSPADVGRWMRAYLQTMMDRDVRDIANVSALREFPRLFRLLATRTATLLNLSDLARSLGLITVTCTRYCRLLEILYFIHLLPAWFSNLGKRLVKSPKLHVCDPAIICQLLELDEKRLSDTRLLGPLLESFVYGELLKQKSWSELPFDLYHMRDGDAEVDFVLERPDGTVVGIEVKCSRSLQSDDLRGLRHLRQLAKGKFRRGLILHLGAELQPLEPDLWAVPLQALWSD